MSRFDPSEVEWPGGEEGPYDAQPITQTAGGEWEPGEPVLCVPADTYRELYEHAEAMARELSARCSCPGYMEKDERCEACRLTDAYRGESDE